jgi:hypothetical protein
MLKQQEFVGYQCVVRTKKNKNKKVMFSLLHLPPLPPFLGWLGWWVVLRRIGAFVKQVEVV